MRLAGSPAHCRQDAGSTLSNLELTRLELVKVKFDEFKDQKKELAPQLAEKTNSLLVTLVGNVAVLYRPKPAGINSANVLPCVSPAVRPTAGKMPAARCQTSKPPKETPKM